MLGDLVVGLVDDLRAALDERRLGALPWKMIGRATSSTRMRSICQTIALRLVKSGSSDC